ncbi:MAG: prolipoprotein diacylglyceryl transferase [Oscillospiraceae bacterium]|jgi:phosphatidylglycerol:prolipoprotein diacylglycerol transferase|nr:prolipoprotein diacylglyceryl transferase [Oscillospiraceae bacterium]
MVGFPGLGIEKLTLESYIFKIGGFGLTWYGLIIAVGFLAAVLYCMKRATIFKVSQNEIIDMLIFAVPSAIVGLRLYEVVFNWQYYSKDFWAVFRIWEGGIAIYGGIIGAFIAAAIFCKVRRIHAGAMLDLGVLGLLIGQAVGRWGNFVNVELYGGETALPWRMRVYSDGMQTFNPPIDVHPLFLYESLWNVLGFVLLHLLAKKRKFNGQLVLMYVAWYGLGRGVLEGMRRPEFSLSIGADIRVSQYLAFISAGVALLILGYMLFFKKHAPDTLTQWTLARDKRLDAKTGAKPDTAVTAEEAPPEETDESEVSEETETRDETETLEETETPDETDGEETQSDGGDS